MSRIHTPLCTKRAWLRPPGRATAGLASFFLSASLLLVSAGCAKRSETAHDPSGGSASAAPRPLERSALTNQGSLIKLHSIPWRIDGKPILGTYLGGTDRMEDLKKNHPPGMNVIFGD